MHFIPFSILGVFLFTGALVSGVALGNPRIASKPVPIRHANLTSRGEPNTGSDLPDIPPHPNNLDKVETAFADVLELTKYVLQKIASDKDIFPHYFNEVDRQEITRIFRVIDNNGMGADMLNKILVQATDSNGLCDGRTLSYLKNGEQSTTEKPYIVLCPIAFRKKARTTLNDAAVNSAYYATCDRVGTHVSYLMNTLGMTLLHEYLHYDKMIASSFGSIIDYTGANGASGYGPVNVYDKLDKTAARTNADSYAYYASHVFWTTFCSRNFEAPRAGTDDEDPDCGNTACHG